MKSIYYCESWKSVTILVAILCFALAACVESPSPALAAIYECRDATGKTVVTDSPKGLHNCEMRSKGTASTLTPSDASPTPQVLLPPIGSDQPSPPTDDPLPPPLHTPQPCSLDLNPLNPMSGPPCVPSKQSRTQPYGAPPVPSQ